jgi:hypothetical protein
VSQDLYVTGCHDTSKSEFQTAEIKTNIAFYVTRSNQKESVIIL